MNEDIKKGGECTKKLYEIINKSAEESGDEFLFWAGLIGSLSGYAAGSIGCDAVSAILLKTIPQLDALSMVVEQSGQAKH